MSSSLNPNTKLKSSYWCIKKQTNLKTEKNKQKLKTLVIKKGGYRSTRPIHPYIKHGFCCSLGVI